MAANCGLAAARSDNMDGFVVAGFRRRRAREARLPAMKQGMGGCRRRSKWRGVDDKGRHCGTPHALLRGGSGGRRAVFGLVRASNDVLLLLEAQGMGYDS